MNYHVTDCKHELSCTVSEHDVQLVNMNYHITVHD